ncbi:MAG: hypothetical protein QXV62_07225 [Nitrososphaerota archaeon]
MRYYDAVKLGEKVAAAAQARLASYVGIAYPAMFLKEAGGEWAPVGEEDFYSLIEAKSGGYIIVICDSDGYAKAISSELSGPMVERCVAKMRMDGLAEFKGKLVLPI